MNVALSAHQAAQLERFARLLGRWNAVYNLTAIAAADLISHHLLDSLAITPAIDAIIGEKSARVLDVGSGGGLPGVPLAIARPTLDVTSIDRIGKKVAFVRQAALDLALPNVHGVHARIEDAQLAPFDLIVSRAFAALADFVRLSRHLLAPRGHWLALKGKRPDGELAALRAEFPAVHVVDVVKLHVPRLDAERHLVLLQGP